MLSSAKATFRGKTTMRTLKISIPHQLGKEEAKRRIQGHFGHFRSQSASLMTQFDEHWSGDDMNFDATLLAAPITGHLRVEEELVDVEVDMPWFLAALSSAVRKVIEPNTRHLLEHHST
jgi:Putative polyhydroxyalkanoic acid system protein (PHA_gran_rgn)